MDIAFLGFGLMAGAIAQAVKSDVNATDWRMRAWSPSRRGPRLAYQDGILDRVSATPADAMIGADLIVLAAPATACLTLLDALAGDLRTSLDPDAVVTDVASTKVAIVQRADEARIRFIGGHPMAGLEMSGYQPGTADILVDRPWVVVPGAIATADDADRVDVLATTCGSVVTRMDARTHDRAVAAISHLPLVVAAALVESVSRVGDAASDDDLWTLSSSLAAGGWRDTTRVARGDPTMAAAIAATNSVELASRIRALRSVLDRWLLELDRDGGPDEAAIRDRFAAARTILDDDR
jgi:prephenate dehydrogenase